MPSGIYIMDSGFIKPATLSIRFILPFTILLLVCRIYGYLNAYLTESTYLSGNLRLASKDCDQLPCQPLYRADIYTFSDLPTSPTRRSHENAIR